MTSNFLLEHVRRIVEQNRLRYDATGGARLASKIQRVGIIGAGRMGTAIAAAHLRRCTLSEVAGGRTWQVVLQDVNYSALQNAWSSIAAELETTAATAQAKFGQFIRLTGELSEAAQCDLVLESIAELLAAKLDLYAQLAPHLSARAIVASNTSTIPIGRLSSGVADPSRLCGFHFCHPVHKRPLVEIVRGGDTSDATVSAAVAHALAIEKIPIVVQDGPGFVVNRLLFPYLGEALELLREGASIEAIDRAATDFGMAMGPLRLMDEIGLDTTLQAAWVLAAAFPDRIVSSPLLVSMIKAGRLGQKSGAGFYRYRGPMTAEALGPADTELAPIVDRWSHPRTPPQEVSSDRLILPMLLEATRILDDRKVAHPRDIDLAVLFGLGFPSERGGLMYWADTLGADGVFNRLRSLWAVEDRAEPTPVLKAWAASGGKFFAS